MKKQMLAILLLLLPFGMTAQNWDYIRTSGEYYYGVGHGQTEVEASEQAMADLVSMIATNVSSEFLGLEDETNTSGNIQHKSKVLSCVRTYSQSTLTNVEKWVVGEAPNVTVRRYMKRSELFAIYENRIAKAKDMIAIADEAVGRTKIDMALQYYYWAYALLRTIQRPNEVTDAKGQIAESDILCKYAPGWKDETREMIMEFLENYKTAYCLKRIDYIRDIFADDAVIIIGNVARRRPGQRHQEREITLEGQEVITTNRYTKDE